MKTTMIALLFLFSIADVCAAQAVVVVDPVYRYPRRIRWAAYDPYYLVTSQVYAQADLIRAQGVAAVDFAIARNLHAEAYSKELDNWRKELRTYWKRKIEAEKLKLDLDHAHQIRLMSYVNDELWKNHRVWLRIKHLSEFNDANIRNGKALNFLLDRLAGTALPYRYDPSTSRFSEAALEPLNLKDDLLQQVTLKQGAYKFTAGEKLDGSISKWPYILRFKEFETLRDAFESSRTAIFDESETTGQASPESIQRMESALLELTAAFHGSDAVAKWVKERNRYTHFYASDRFLQEMDLELRQLEKTADIRPFAGQSGYDPNADGDHLVSLLCFMNRNGVEFAPATPGNEGAYYRLFQMMRGLYLTVADNDESTQPGENLGDRISVE